MRVPDKIVLFGSASDWRRMFVAASHMAKCERQALYAAYLRSAAWSRKRKLAEETHGILCIECRFAVAENIHHKTYARIGDEDVNDLVPLCRSCHKAKHGMEMSFLDAVQEAHPC